MLISSTHNRVAIRRAVAVTAAAAATAAVSMTGAGTGAAHVSANAPTLTQGGYGVVTFVVPNESDTAATTSLTVTLPDLKSARPEVMSGWKAEVVKDPESQATTSITWTALPGTPGVPVGEFAQFRVSGGPFPEEETVTLPATQVYADGETVDWAQTPGPDGAEPDHPAPTLTLPVGSGDHHGGSHGGTSTTGETTTESASNSGTTDNAARWLGGIGLLIGAVGAVVGVAGLTRARRGGDNG